MNSEYGQRLSLQELKQRNTQQAVLPTQDVVSVGDIALYFVDEKVAKILSIREDENGQLYGLRWNPDERIEIGNDDLSKIHKVVAIEL